LKIWGIKPPTPRQFPHCLIVRSCISEAETTNNKKNCARRFVLKLYRHEASRGLFATAELLANVITHAWSQSSVIGPTLFLLFVNDVIDIFYNLAVSFKLYADDIKLYSCYNITSSCDDLSVAINRLYDWQLTVVFGNVLHVEFVVTD